jgi:hypothetical protein
LTPGKLKVLLNVNYAFLFNLIGKHKSST